MTAVIATTGRPRRPDRFVRSNTTLNEALHRINHMRAVDAGIDNGKALEDAILLREAARLLGADGKSFTLDELIQKAALLWKQVEAETIAEPEAKP